MIVGSQLKNAQIECYTAAQIADDTAETMIKDLVIGRMVYDTTNKQVMVYDGSNWKEVAYDMSEIILDNNVTPTNPTGNNVKIFAKSDNKIYVLDSSGTETELGSGSGSGGKNYIENPGGEGASINGWLEYDSTLAIPTGDPTGGELLAANLALTAPVSDLLSGANNLLLTKGTDNAMGEGVYYPFTIDKADCAKKMVISFDYKTENADYEDGFIKIFIWDGTSIVRVNGEDVKAVSGVGKHYAQFQTHATTVDCKLLIHVNEAGSDDWTLRLDNVSVAPQKISHGAIVTDWEDITTAANGTLGGSDETIVGNGYLPSNIHASEIGYYENYRTRRVGQNLEMRFIYIHEADAPYSCGAGDGSSDITFPIPNGLSLDVSSGITYYSNVGTVNSYKLDHAPYGTGYTEADPELYATSTVTAGSGNYIRLTRHNSDQLMEGDHVLSDGQIRVLCSVPIQGWSSNAKMSEDFSGRDIVSLQHSGDSTQYFVSGAAKAIKFAATGSKVFDTTGDYDSSTGKYTIPETGFYMIHAKVTLDVNQAIRGEYIHFYIENDTLSANIDSTKWEVPTWADSGSGDVTWDNIEDNDISLSIGGVHHLIKGHEIWCLVHHNLTTATTYNAENNTSRLNSDNNLNKFNVVRVASAQTLLENETVAMRTSRVATQAVSDADGATILFDTTAFDTHGGYSTGTGIYTVPITGFYQVNTICRLENISSAAGTTSDAVDTGDWCTLRIMINQSSKVYNFDYPVTGTQYVSLQVSELFELTKGQEVQIFVNPNDDSSFTITGSDYTTFSIAKIK